MQVSRSRRLAYWLASEFLLLIVAAVFPALLIFHAARTLDVAAKRKLLGASDPYPSLRDLLDWDASVPHSQKQPAPNPAHRRERSSWAAAGSALGVSRGEAETASGAVAIPKRSKHQCSSWLSF